MHMCHRKYTYYHDLDIVLHYLPGGGGIFSYPFVDRQVLPATVPASRGGGGDRRLYTYALSGPHLNYFWCSLQCFRSGTAWIRINLSCWKQEGKNDPQKLK